ncbi:MAG: NAD(P)H-binding protein [Myxococcota bacterium]
MKLAVVGATGRIGSQVVRLALADGHTVRALTRAEPPDEAEPGLEWVEGDALDPSSVARLTTGTDAVIVALGPRPDSPPDLCGRGTTTAIAACRAFRIGTLVVLTGAMIGHPRELLAWPLRTLSWTWRTTRAVEAADRARQEELVTESGLGWTLVRPPRIVDGPPSGAVEAGSELFVQASAHATVGDVARTMVDAAVTRRWAQSGVVVLSP